MKRRETISETRRRHGEEAAAGGRRGHLVLRRANSRGFTLVSVYLVLVVLLILGGALVANAVAEIRMAQRSEASLQALYMAEAGVDYAIVGLRDNWAAASLGSPVGALGSYSVTIDDMGNNRMRITSQGSSTLLDAPILRSVEVITEQEIPPEFYENVIWASQQLDINGNSYSVTGDIRHGDLNPEGNMANVIGTVTYDPKVFPLPALNFQKLYDMASAQGNVYDAARLGNGHGVFPTSFWYTAPTDPTDPTTGVPNVNYLTTDLILNGNIGTIGGFFVVVGNVLTDPTSTEDSTLNGNGQIEGAVYTTGNFRVNGGGQGLNVHGGVWAGDEARLNGKTTLVYHRDYLRAIEALDLSAVELVSWRDLS